MDDITGQTAIIFELFWSNQVVSSANLAEQRRKEQQGSQMT